MCFIHCSLDVNYLVSYKPFIYKQKCSENLRGRKIFCVQLLLDEKHS